MGSDRGWGYRTGLENALRDVKSDGGMPLGNIFRAFIHKYYRGGRNNRFQ